MPFVRIEGEFEYEIKLTHTLLRFRRFICDGDPAQHSILPIVGLSCLDYPFLSAWFATRCGHFQDTLEFEHQFHERTFPRPVFVPWHCVEVYPIRTGDRDQFYVPVDCH